MGKEWEWNCWNWIANGKNIETLWMVGNAFEKYIPAHLELLRFKSFLALRMSGIYIGRDVITNVFFTQRLQTISFPFHSFYAGLPHLCKKVEMYLYTKFPWHISFNSSDKTTSGFRTGTIATLDLYFRFWFCPLISYRHVVWDIHAKLRSHRTIGGRVMTSHLCSTTAAMDSKMYFRFLLKWRRPFTEVEICMSTKFPWDISIYRWDDTASGFGKRTKFLFPVLLSPYMCSHRHVVLHPLDKFCINRTIGGRLVTLYRIRKMTAIPWRMRECTC